MVFIDSFINANSNLLNSENFLRNTQNSLSKFLSTMSHDIEAFRILNEEILKKEWVDETMDKNFKVSYGNMENS